MQYFHRTIITWTTAILQIGTLAVCHANVNGADSVPKEVCEHMQNIVDKLQHCRINVISKYGQRDIKSDELFVPFSETYWLDGEYVQIGSYPVNAGRKVKSLDTVRTDFEPSLEGIQEGLNEAAGEFKDNKKLAIVSAFDWIAFYRPVQSPRVTILFRNEDLLRDRLAPFVVNSGDSLQLQFRSSLPLLKAGRPRICPKESFGDCCLTRLFNIMPDKWEVIGEEKVRDYDCIKMRVERSPSQSFALKNNDDVLKLRFYYIVWCSKVHRLLPVKVSDVAPGANVCEYKDMVYPAPDSFGGCELDILDVFELHSGIWYPREVCRRVFTIDTDKRQTGFPMDADQAAQQLVEKGAFCPEYVLKWRSSIQSRVVSWAPLQANSQVHWITCPDGMMQRNLDTRERSIRGKSKEEMEKILRSK